MAYAKIGWKFMKRIIIALLAVIMLAVSFTACGDSNEKLIAEQDKVILQLGYSYFNELMIVSKELSNGERSYYCLSFDDDGIVENLVICRFFTSESAYRAKYEDVERRVDSDECKIVRTQEDVLMLAYNDPLELSEVEGLTFLQARQHYTERGWTYVKRPNSDDGSAS